MTTLTYTAEQRTVLLGVGTDAIRQILERGVDAPPEVAGHDDTLRRPAATFVTLERDRRLLGCIGSLEPTHPLVTDVARNAVAAAFRDPRLPPVTADDYRTMSIEISVLSELAPVPATTYDELVASLSPGRDGLVVEAGPHRATFLPAVWRHFGVDVDAFLDGLWRKAGLAPGTWPRDARCSRYTAEKLVDPGPRPPVGAA